MARYRLYVDESGDHTYKNLEDIGRRYLGITGIAIESDYYRNELQPKLEHLKQTHFPHSPDDPLILHREDIYNRRYQFGVLTNQARNAAWESDLTEFIRQARFHLFTVVIDKKNHKERYGESAIHPYHLCLRFLMERYRGALMHLKGKGDILAESRGGKEDMSLKAIYEDIYNNGTYYISSQEFTKVLTSRRLKVKSSNQNIGGLQIADLLAHPSKLYVLISSGRIPDSRSAFSKRLADAFKNKYDRIGRKVFD